MMSILWWSADKTLLKETADLDSSMDDCKGGACVIILHYYNKRIGPGVIKTSAFLT